MNVRVHEAWSRFWFAPHEALPLGVVRIGVAVSGLYLWGGTLPWLRRYYSDLGEFPIEAARGWTMELFSWYLLPDFMGSFGVVVFLAALHFVALVALLLGYRTRVAALAVAFLTLWFFFRNPTLANGGDEVMRLVTGYLALAYLFIPVEGRALSLDRRLAVKRGDIPADAPVAPVPAWTLRLIQIQISIVYLVAGFWKVMGAPWWDGSALYLALHNATFTRFGVPEWAWLRWPFTVYTITVAWWEFLFPVLVWIRRARVPTLLFGLALHAGIFLFMNIGVFPVVMMACYAAFFREDELRRAGRWVAALVGGRPSPEAGAAAAA